MSPSGIDYRSRSPRGVRANPASVKAAATVAGSCGPKTGALLIRSIKGQFSPDYFGPIDYAALYWHIVDLIWIFLFPLLYLIS